MPSTHPSQVAQVIAAVPLTFVAKLLEQIQEKALTTQLVHTAAGRSVFDLRVCARN